MHSDAPGCTLHARRIPKKPIEGSLERLQADPVRRGGHPVVRGEGWAVNRKRVHRLWRKTGLQVPQKTRKRLRLAATSGENSTVRRASERPNHVWAYDFVFDATEDGRALKLLTVLDEYTRECLALVVGRSLTSRHVVDTLDRLIAERGAPNFVWSDNGGEFIAHRVAA